eukprot:1326024-Pyramimonas_sp.AAC.1
MHIWSPAPRAIAYSRQIKYMSGARSGPHRVQQSGASSVMPRAHGGPTSVTMVRTALDLRHEEKRLGMKR